jgi:membrane-bound metal-dependent hydrolase YbcI (DUF457 family)
MNYVHHALIGIGTASLGVLAAEALGAPQVPPLVLAAGAVVTAAGSIATDLDHPKSFVANTIPLRVVRWALAILALPALAAVGAYLTRRDLNGALEQYRAAVFGIAFLRWTAIALALALGLMGLSWLLYKSLHHRGPLHSLVFTTGITVVACLAFWGFGSSWTWGLLFGWGWLWHILGDGLTDQGVPLFWPFNDDRLHVLPGWGRGLGRVLLTVGAILGILGLIYLRLRSFLG